MQMKLLLLEKLMLSVHERLKAEPCHELCCLRSWRVAEQTTLQKRRLITVQQQDVEV